MARPPTPSPGHGLARALSKLGVCSRAEAFRRIQAGRVRVNGVVCRDPERRVWSGADRIEVDGEAAVACAKIYLMLNKPRGLVTTADDEKGRATVFECLKGVDVRHLLAVGRLDRASEGLLLVTNDTEWAARITDPASRVEKVYHVQVDAQVTSEHVSRMLHGVPEGAETLMVKAVSILRRGEKNCWLEVTLDEGRNRHLRRLLNALGFEVSRLVRVRIGGLELGALAKGAYRELTRREAASLVPVGLDASGSPSTRDGD